MEQAKKTMKQMRSKFLAAFFVRNLPALKKLEQEALNKGLCISTDNLCDEDRCYCKK